MLARDGGMNVPNINQVPGGVAAPPRAEAEAGRNARSRLDGETRNVGFTRLAWFDVNGDGNIDPRSASAGGDATLLVPAHSVDLPTYARAAHTTATTHGASSPAPPSSPPPAQNAAQTSRAVDAYQRYGQPPAPAPVPAPEPTPDTLGAVAASPVPAKAVA
jgi:hypothetical protein